MTRLHLRERRGGERGGFSGSESLSSSDRTSNQNKSSSQRKVSSSGSRNSSSKSPSKASVKGSNKNSKKKNPVGRKTNNSLAASLPSGSNSDEDENEEPENCDGEESDGVVKSKKKSNRDEEIKNRVVKSKKKLKVDEEDNNHGVKSKKKIKDDEEDSDCVVKSKKKSKEDEDTSDRAVKSKKKPKEDELESDRIISKSKKKFKIDEDNNDRITKSKKNPKEDEGNESRSRSSSPNPRSNSSPSKKQKNESSLKTKKKKSGGREESVTKKLKTKNKSKDKKRLKLRHRDKSKEKDKIKSRDNSDKINSISKPKEKGPSITKPSSAMVTVHSTGGMSKTKMKSSVLFSQSEEDVQIGMHKVIESIKNHGDAWPFLNPVDEDYAPNYYRVISSPMDLQTIEDKLDNQEYSSLDEFIADFQRIVDNCTKYNGPSNEYTEMAETLQEAFNKAIQRYIIPDESDEEISIEYNNVEVERKRPRLQNHSKKEEAPPEHKKENEPSNAKNATVINKSKVDKSDKKKMKQKLMGHHSRNSEAIENLTSATAETLKDINKWLGDTPKPPVYQSSPGSLGSESVKTRIPDEDMEGFRKKSDSIAGQKRKNPISLNNRSVSGKREDKKKDDDDDDEDFTPPKKMLKKSDKHGKSDNKPKTKKESKEKAGESSPKKSQSKDSKEKDKHHHKHHKHHHSSSVNRKRDSPTKVNNKVNGSNITTAMASTGSNRDCNREKDVHNSQANQPKDNSFDKIALKHSKSVEEKKTKAPIKRGNSLLNSLKNSGAMKRMQQINKTPKFNSFHTESKFKSASGENKGTTDHFSGTNVQSTGRDNGLLGEKPEKKKCLLLNDNSSDREGGPRLSLGSVLSTDAIKLGEFKKDEVFSDDDYESTISINTQKIKSKSGSAEPEVNDVKGSEEKTADVKVPLTKDIKEIESELEKEEDLEADRKLEPSKGFNREKCMPNLSAWIKAFGGPAKAASGPGTGNPQIKKPDPESKNKFKVMGRGVGESNTNQSANEPLQKGTSKNSPGSKNLGKPVTETYNKTSGVQSPLVSPNKSNEQIRTVTPSEDVSSNEQHHTNKKRRHRKMSTSSLSSQSESGSPHCFNPQDGSSGGVANVVNPPRWVDEHWTQSHSQSQSPSASSHVSSQSPANSPFSPAINSPPHTPQTPPRPVGPVHVGFYQDITTQHSGPKNPNEPHSNSNSNVASPSTPPTPTSTNNSRRGETCSNTGSGKAGYGSYPAPVYTPRYAASTPSPNVGPGSNIQSPSPGGMGSVESPGAPNSPHSPNVVNVGGSSNSLPSLPDYRNLPYGQSSQQPNTSTPHQNTQQPPAHQQQTTAHRVTSSILNAHGGHAPPPSIAPYPPPVSHYGHPGSMSQPHPESAHSGQIPAQAHQPALAHMNQVQAHSQISHQQHYERYPPHNLAHHQMNPQSGMLQSSVPTSSTVATSYSQNMTAAHSQRPSTAQPSPYPSNPYASNPRSINIPPNVYNNPISSDPAMNRFYKPSVSGGELSLTANMSASSSGIGEPTTSTAPSSGSHSRGRSSRGNAAAATETEIPRNAPTNLDGKLGHGELNGFQWPHNLASLSQIVNSIPNPMGAVGMANAYRQYDQAMAESMSKYQRADPSGYTSLSASAGANAASVSVRSGTPVHHPPTAHSQSDKNVGDASSESSGSSSRSRSSKSTESKASRSQGSSSKVTAQSMVPGSAFNFSSLSPADLALYPKEMSDPGSLYSASQSGHLSRPDLYPTSTSNFHPSFSSASRTTAGGVPTSSLTPYQIPPFIGSHPSPYQPQSVSSQPFAHSQPPRGLTVDPYQQFFQSSPHVMGLLPPTGYPYPHGLGFNRPGWI